MIKWQIFDKVSMYLIIGMTYILYSTTVQSLYYSVHSTAYQLVHLSDYECIAFNAISIFNNKNSLLEQHTIYLSKKIYVKFYFVAYAKCRLEIYMYTYTIGCSCVQALQAACYSCVYSCLQTSYSRFIVVHRQLFIIN